MLSDNINASSTRSESNDKQSAWGMFVNYVKVSGLVISFVFTA